MKTMICLILDRSGSMSGRELDVVGGVNTFIADQKTEKEEACLGMVRFDSEGIERFRDMVDLQKCDPLKESEFKPRGGTPLLDAVGETVEGLDRDWIAQKPDRCIVVIVTDGQENASRKFTLEKIKELIQARQDSGKWSFIYLGANVDAFAEARGLGINLSNTASYTVSASGMASTYNNLTANVKSMRVSGQTVASDLGGIINEDGSLTKTITEPQVTVKAKVTWTVPSLGGK